jgi:dihydroorotate dehydrogenase
MAAKNINAGIAAYLERHDLASVSELVGSLELGESEDKPLSG